jgi:hypothetical protein
MAEIECFMLEPTTRERRWLRRYRSVVAEDPCSSLPGLSYHNARVLLDEVEAPGVPTGGDSWPHDDPRWPTRCACGYQFVEADAWQLFTERLFRRLDTGEEVVLREAPAGAMWYADWLRFWTGPDGRCLCVMLPDGHEWVIDGPSTDGGSWTREGTPPKVTVRPSIGRQRKDGGWVYHAFLTEGKLVEV